MREKAFENKITKWLVDHGIYKANTPIQNKKVPEQGWYFKMWGGGMSESGIPDLICNIKGKFVAIEVKGDGGRPSELQIKNIDAINNSGGYGWIPYPKDWEELKGNLEKLLED